MLPVSCLVWHEDRFNKACWNYVMSYIGLKKVALYMLLVLDMQFSYADELPLLQAAKQADITAITRLLAQDEDVNASQNDGATALSWVVYHDMNEGARLLLEYGADVNMANDMGVTPLSLACDDGNSDMVSLLLKAGADPNIARITGETPLMTCAASNAVNAVSELISHGADINAREHDEEQSALMWSVAAGIQAITGMLLDAGADVEARSRLIPEPEPFVIEIPNGDSVFGTNYPRSVRFPESRGGFTALHFAAQQGDIASVSSLLTAGADVNSVHSELGGPLSIAIASGHQQLAEYLLEQGADPDTRDAWGLTPLHLALHEGLLILNNFRPSRTDRFGWERPNMPALVERLLDAGAEVDPRIVYSYAYHHDPFIARGTEDPPQVDPVGATPLLLAAASGDLDAMKTLLVHGADRDASTVGGANLFMLAAGVGAERRARGEKEALAAARFVLGLGGVDVNTRLTELAAEGPGKDMPDGRTALHQAVYFGWTTMIRFLVDNGARLNASDRYGMTPMLLAMGDPRGLYYRQIGAGNYDLRYRRPPAEPNEKVVELLLELGAKPYTGGFRDRSGE